jgi:hypothetical protein
MSMVSVAAIPTIRKSNIVATPHVLPSGRGAQGNASTDLQPITGREFRELGLQDKDQPGEAFGIGTSKQLLIIPIMV